MAHPPKILLIESEPTQALRTMELLEDHGFEVEWLRTVAEGRERLTSHAFRLVLTDYLTTGVSEAEPQMRELLDAAGAVPVVCVSAWRFFRSTLSDRFAFVLYKPFVPEELLGIAGMLLSIERRPHEVAQIERYFEALSRRDWAALGALCTDDVEYRAPQASSAAPHVVVGRSNFESMARDTFAAFPGATFEVVEVTPLPQGAVARYVGRWQLPDQTLGSLEAAVTFRFEAGRIAGIGVRLDAEKVRAMSEAPPDLRPVARSHQARSRPCSVSGRRSVGAARRWRCSGAEKTATRPRAAAMLPRCKTRARRRATAARRMATRATPIPEC